jgi:uncharacterized protein
VEFEWDEVKNRANLRKHGISFERAKQIFSGPVFTRFDERSDYGEHRLASTGLLNGIMTVVVVHVDRNSAIRIISARKAERHERQEFEAAIFP